MIEDQRIFTIFVDKLQIEPAVWNRLLNRHFWNLAYDYADQDISLQVVENGATSPREIKVYKLGPFLSLDNRYGNAEVKITDDGLEVLYSKFEL